jgi:hypothetical protein
MAHGSLYALGAYAAATLAGAWLRGGHAPLGSYAMLVLAAVLVGVVIGPLIERGLLRFTYGKDEVVLVLVTYALFLMLEDAVKLIWGVESYFISEPYGLLGTVELGPLSYPVYSAVLVGAAVAIGLALRWGIYRTRYGKLLIAVIHDREVSAALAEQHGLHEQHTDHQREMQAMLEEAWATARKTGDLEKFYESDLLPLADQSVEAALLAWRSNRAMVDEVVTARRVATETRLKHLRLAADRAQAQFDVDYLAGEEP